MFGKYPQQKSELTELLTRLLKQQEHPLYQTTTITTGGPSFLATTAAGIAAGLAATGTTHHHVASRAFKIAKELETLIVQHEAETAKWAKWSEYSGSCPDQECSGGVVRGECDQCKVDFMDKIQES